MLTAADFTCPLPTPQDPLRNLPLQFGCATPKRKRKARETGPEIARALAMFRLGVTPNQIKRRMGLCGRDWSHVCRAARIPQSTQAMGGER